MHHLAGLVQTLSLCLVHTHTHTHTRQAKRRPHAHSLQMLRRKHTTKYALESHTEIQGFARGINKSFSSGFRKGMTLTHTPNTAREIQGQKVRRRSQHTPAVMWSKLRVETEIAERGSTAEQPLSRLHVPVEQCILGYLTFTLFNILTPNLGVLTLIHGWLRGLADFKRCKKNSRLYRSAFHSHLQRQPHEMDSLEVYIMKA